MNVVEDDVVKLVSKELNNANKHFPLFQSPHEGYAVIKEEVEETMDAMNELLERFSEAWNGIKGNDEKETLTKISLVWGAAIDVATEAIQIAAVCDKYNLSLADRLEWSQNAEHCVSCGAVIPEGRMVCPACDKKVEINEL